MGRLKLFTVNYFFLVFINIIYFIVLIKNKLHIAKVFYALIGYITIFLSFKFQGS
jgi:hypothetical protein